MDTATLLDEPLPLLRQAGWLAEIARPDPTSPQQLLPLFCDSVPAGFPSPAQGHEEPPLDLNEHIIQRPEATYLLRVQGHSMAEANIRDGDIVVVDRSITPRHGHIVIAEIEGGFTIKTLWRRGGQVKLVAANPAYKPIHCEAQLVVFGVVTWILHKAIG